MTSSKLPVILVPGILTPGALRFTALLNALGDGVEAVVKELEIYAGDAPPEGYSIESEVEGLSRSANAAGFERFHLFGYSAGGAVALAYVDQHPDRVLSLALDEPASDFSEPDRHLIETVNEEADRLPSSERMAAFVRFQLAPDVEPPSRPEGPPPPWMQSRLVGIEVFPRALAAHRVSPDAWRRFERPVYYSYGSLSHPRWREIGERLGGAFPRYRMEVFEGLHHLNASHQVEPTRVARTLQTHWGSSPSS